MQVSPLVALLRRIKAGDALGRLQGLGLALLLLAAAFAAQSQPAKVFRVGVVFNSVARADLSGPNPKSIHAKAFIEGLRDHGWIEGRNIRIYWRSTEDRYADRTAMIEELVQLPVDVLVVGGNPATKEALRLARNVPIVTIGMLYPVENGFIRSLARPGGNLTGLVADTTGDIYAKRLELLKKAAPQVSRVAVLLQKIPGVKGIEIPEARSLGVDVFMQDVDSPDQIEAAIERAAQEGANGLVVNDDNPFFHATNVKRVDRAAQRHRLPAIYSYQGSSDSGGMMTYSEDLVRKCRRTAYFVDRILRGSKPGEIPAEMPAMLELAINLKSARSIGLDIPAELLIQADRVIK